MVGCSLGIGDLRGLRNLSMRPNPKRNHHLRLMGGANRLVVLIRKAGRWRNDSHHTIHSCPNHGLAVPEQVMTGNSSRSSPWFVFTTWVKCHKERGCKSMSKRSEGKYLFESFKGDTSDFHRSFSEYLNNKHSAGWNCEDCQFQMVGGLGHAY